MKRILLLLVFTSCCMAQDVAKEKDYPLTAVMGTGRGKYPGEYVTELRIGHTVYVSPDVCRKAEVGWNMSYPARLHDQTIWVLVGSTSCKYHVSDEHPFLARKSRTE